MQAYSDTAVDIPQYIQVPAMHTHTDRLPDIHAEKVPDMESGLPSSATETESGSQGAATLYPQSPTIPLNLTQQGGPDPYPHRQWAGHLLCPSLHSWMQMGRGSSITHCSHVNLLPAWAGAPHLPFAPSGAQRGARSLIIGILVIFFDLTSSFLYLIQQLLISFV